MKLKTYEDFVETLGLMERREIIYTEGENLKYATPTNKPNGLLFLCSLIWPFIDSFWLTLVYIYTLFPTSKVDEAKILNKIQWFAESLYEDNIVVHYESCSFDIISRAVDHFIAKEIIVRDTTNPENVQISLHESYRQDENLIQKEFDKITFFKKLSLIKFTNLKTDIQKTMLSDFPMMANL